MTPVFCCGFECGRTGTVGQHWNVSNANCTITNSGQRSGDRCAKLEFLTSQTGYFETTVSSSNAFVIRCYVKIDVFPDGGAGSSANLIVDGTNKNGAALFNDSGTWKIFARGASIDVTTGVAVSSGIWYRLDIKIDQTGNPHKVDVKVNGVSTVQSQTSVAGNSSTTIRLGESTSSRIWTANFDDFVLSNTLGDFPIGDGYITHFVPTSDGTHNVAGTNDFERGTLGTDILNSTTDSYLLVDDVPLTDTTPVTDDFINAIAPANATDYTENKFGPAPGVAVSIYAPRCIQVILGHHQFATGVGVSAFKLNDNGTEDTILSLNGAGVTTLRYAGKHYATMVGGGAWTTARFQNLRIRFGYSSDANPDQYFDCAMIEAEFSHPAGNQNIVRQAVKRESLF